MNENMEFDRVRRHTSPEMLAKIDGAIEQSVLTYASRSPEEISRRIDELDREWDIERLLETNASSFALTGVLLGVFVNRKWLLLTGGVCAFLLQHALHGWCPPVPVLRRLGVRTQSEIDREKYALKYLRGDFDEMPKQRLERARAKELASAVAT